MRIAVSIPTHNRCEDLRRTLEALRQMNPPADEIRVIADGCTDDTVSVVRSEFPHVNLEVRNPGEGSIAARDYILRKTEADLVLSLDDDSYPESQDFIEPAIRRFTSNPKLAVLTFPQRSDEFPSSLEIPEPHYPAPMRIGTYTNSGSVIRVSAYRSCPGYTPSFFHAYEEPDFALQCIASGWFLALDPGEVIRHHYTSAQRNEMRTHHRHARNECWSILLRAPDSRKWPLLFRRLLGQAAYASSRGAGWLLNEPRWWWQAAKGARSVQQRRAPVDATAYTQWLTLLRTPQRFGPEEPLL